MSQKRLITESDVRAMTRGSKLVLGPDVIATPAALDAAFERGLAIVRASESSASGGCGCGGTCGGCSGGGGTCTWSKMLAQDATYVVVVKNGIARVAVMTESGPVPFA